MENKILKVKFGDRPFVKEYLHKSTGTVFGAGNDEGYIIINRVPYNLNCFDMSIEKDDNSIAYILSVKDKYSFTMEFTLESNYVSLLLKNIVELGENIETIEFKALNLLVSEDRESFYWREEWSRKPWDSKLGRGLYNSTVQLRRIGDGIPDSAALGTIHACVFNKGACSFVYSNYPYMPITTCLQENSKYPERAASFSICLNKYQYRIRDKFSKGLEVKIVFLEDINGDNTADECDYKLWLNRQFKKPQKLYKERIWYKIGCGENGKVHTTFNQALEIIEKIHNVTGGMPQLVYLVGWQYEGHDSGYPSLDKINEALGTKEDLLNLITTAKEKYDCIVSYHINVDDSYREHPGFDESIICKDMEGSCMAWEEFNGKLAYHICHTKDVESRKIFERLEKMLQTVPVEQTIHLDAFRCTNCSWEEYGFIGVMEELECGVKHIIKYFEDRDIDVTTEAVDNLGIEAAGLFSAVWHMYEPQIYHGKILGGGRGTGAASRGIGGSIDIDINYELLIKDKNKILDQLFLGTMLYKLYLTKEMTEYRLDKESQNIRLNFQNEITTFIDLKNNSLEVKYGSAKIADETSASIPLEDGIYVYSKNGGIHSWELPDKWRNKPLKAEALTMEGPPKIIELKKKLNSIVLELEKNVPVKIS